MKRYLPLFLLLTGCILLLIKGCNTEPEIQAVANDSVTLFPDYTDIIIPENISPLNFIILEKGQKYNLRFMAENKKYSFSIQTKDSVIIIPLKKWRKLLESASRSSYILTISVKNDGQWNQFKPIVNKVSPDFIDPYIVYRRINPGMVYWDNMAIVQRSLEDFSEANIISNQNTGNNCMHCHTFLNGDPGTFILHLRKPPAGTIIRTQKGTRWLNSATPYTLSPFVYPSWHPGGRYIAFSTNRIHQNFFGKGERINHVRDDASDIVIYDLDSNLVFTSPELSSFDFENLPSWAPDGNFLYFIRSPHQHKYLPDTAEKYDLLRISFKEENREFGEPEVLISSGETASSMSFPQVSPDGKYLAFCMADYGYFNINNPSSDLYLLNLSTLEYSELPINSAYSESWPCWSQNSRWLMFTTRRIDGVFTVPHFAYVDSSGNAGKPFPLPLKYPEEFFTRITNFNRPVFVTGKVAYSPDDLQRIVVAQTGNVIFDTINVEIDALSGSTVNKSVSETGTSYMED